MGPLCGRHLTAPGARAPSLTRVRIVERAALVDDFMTIQVQIGARGASGPDLRDGASSMRVRVRPSASLGSE